MAVVSKDPACTTTPSRTTTVDTLHTLRSSLVDRQTAASGLRLRFPTAKKSSIEVPALNCRMAASGRSPTNTNGPAAQPNHFLYPPSPMGNYHSCICVHDTSTCSSAASEPSTITRAPRLTGECPRGKNTRAAVLFGSLDGCHIPRGEAHFRIRLPYALTRISRLCCESSRLGHNFFREGSACQW